MALNLGELVAFLSVDDKGMDQGLDKAEGKFGKFSGAMKAGAAGAALAIGAALAAGIAEAMDVQKANDKLAAQLGLSAEESERVGGVAGSLYAAAYGESLEEVNGAVAAVMGSIDGMRNASSEDLEAVTANALDFATAMDVDVAGAATTAGLLLKTGLAVDAREAFDLMTKAAQEAGPTMIEPIMEAANEYGTNFAAMGFSGREAMALLVDASRNGEIALDKVGDAVKEFSILSTDGSKATAEAYDAIGLNADEMAERILAGGTSARDATDEIVAGLLGIQDPATQANTAIALFGSPLEDLGVTEIPAFLEALQMAGGELENVAGAADAMGATLNDNAMTNLESFKRQATQAFVDLIGGQVLPKVNEFASFLATNFGPALETIGSFITGTVVPAFQAFGQWLDDNRGKIEVVAQVIGAIMLPALARLGFAALINAGKMVLAWGMSVAGAIGAGLVYIAQSVLIVGRWAFMAGQSLLQAGRMAAAWFIALGPIGWAIAAVGIVIGVIIAYWDEIVAATKAAWDAVVGAVSAAWEWIKDAVGKALDWLVDLFLNFTGPGLIIKHWDSIREATVTAFNAVVDFITGIPGRAIAALSALGSSIAGVASSAWTMFKDAVSTGIGWVIDLVTGLPGKVLSALGDLGSTLWDLGKDLIQGLLDGAGSLLRNIGSFFLNLVPSWIRGPFESALGIASPSKVFAGYGANIGEGLIAGMAGMRPAVAAEMAALADTQSLGSLAVGGTVGGFGGPGGVGSTLGARVVVQHDTIVQTTGDPDAIARAIDTRNRDREYLAGAWAGAL